MAVLLVEVGVPKWGVSWGLQEIQMMTVDLCIDCGKVVPGKLPGRKFRKRDMAENEFMVSWKDAS